MKKFELDKHDKINTGFRVPENYFDSFEDKLFTQIEFNKVEPKIIPLWKKTSTWLMSTAAIVTIGLGIILFQMNSDSEIELTSENLIAMEDHLTTEDFAEYLSNEDIVSLENELYKIDELSEQDIIDNLN